MLDSKSQVTLDRWFKKEREIVQDLGWEIICIHSIICFQSFFWLLNTVENRRYAYLRMNSYTKLVFILSFIHWFYSFFYAHFYDYCPTRWSKKLAQFWWGSRLYPCQFFFYHRVSPLTDRVWDVFLPPSFFLPSSLHSPSFPPHILLHFHSQSSSVFYISQDQSSKLYIYSCIYVSITITQVNLTRLPNALGMGSAKTPSKTSRMSWSE